MNNSDLNLSWLEKLLKFKEKYGIWNIISSLLLLFISSLVLKLCVNPTFLFDKYREYYSQTHEIDLNKRSEKDEKLKKLLPSLLSKYKADRIWIIQYHNGTLDWEHGTMRFEYCNPELSPIINQYDNFNLSWFNFPYYLKDHNMFIGDLKDIEELDKTLYLRLSKNGTKYLACILIRNENHKPTEIFGISWNYIPNDSIKSKIEYNLIEDRCEIKALTE